jgi:hypothetical protein
MKQAQISEMGKRVCLLVRRSDALLCRILFGRWMRKINLQKEPF